jgi:hypothetical protein
VSDLAPGKGAHLVLNDAVLGFLSTALSDLADQYSDEVHDKDPKAVRNALLEEGVPTLIWTGVKDSFGDKVIAEMPYKKGALRVTLVLTRQGELRLDIREWFTPSGE